MKGHKSSGGDESRTSAARFLGGLLLKKATEIHQNAKGREGSMVLQKPWQRAIVLAALAGSLLVVIAHLMAVP